jgi:phosphatidate cytidylyltransferase
MAVTLTVFYPLLAQPGTLTIMVLLSASVAWAAASVRLMDYQRGGQGLPDDPMFIGGLGIAALLCAWIALCGLHARPSQGPYWVIFLMVLIWTADIAAYFAGRRWGHRRLADRLSPGKTWAGVWGALAASLVVAMLGLQLFGVTGVRYYMFLAVAVATVLFSIVGDLFESLLKRKAGVKDSGSVLPGHGGILDRIDSLLAASPIFAVGVMILEHST